MNAAGYKIRPMTGADISRVSGILCEGFRLCAAPDSYSASQLEALLKDRGSVSAVEEAFRRYPGRWFVAGQNVIAGFIYVEKNEIGLLYVANKFQRRGIATALFRYAQEIISRTYDNMFLTTTGYGAPFYLAMGMTKTGTVICDNGPLYGNILMKFEKSPL